MSEDKRKNPKSPPPKYPWGKGDEKLRVPRDLEDETNGSRDV